MRLSVDTVTSFLHGRGVITPDTPTTATVLAGGVSGATFLVYAGGVRYVVKQPLPFLAVADEWPARQERAGVEAAALGWLADLTPGHLPRLLDYDPSEFVLTMTAAPPGWAEWRSVLLGGRVDVAAGATLGRVLGTWHASSAGAPERLATYGDLTMFLELRGDPYHRTVAARRPDLAEPVLACLDELLTRQSCLVHGDFSPKNVLVGAAVGAADASGTPAADLWVLDFEVAHAGNPVFDVAFLLHHLVMKAVHLSTTGSAGARCAAELLACADAFRAEYAAAGGLAVDEAAVVRHTGALLLARVHGKSPAAYLSADGAAEVSALGAHAVTGELGSVAELFPHAPGPPADQPDVGRTVSR
ncbi:phosphotransferase [Actinopolymorpha pittospori]|uniref:5-methylthioribose kinase n=1 Tax=Actinopolymorpha pittospori TaxID=648752 RepID=A0A927N651_9ACTN|nr:5-methylthioribose kinase [Actinopolymorpha pittospori]